MLGPAEGRDVALAREAGLELVVASDEIPEGVRVHLKLDTGMGRYGLAELPEPPVEVVGLMTHLATADSDPAFAQEQIARFRAATDSHAHLTRHVANSAAVLRIPESRFDAARCGIALYGLSPFGESPEADGLEPALHWQSYLAQVKLLAARREHRVRAALRRRAADVDRDRPGRLRRRVPPGAHAARPFASAASPPASSEPSRWTRSRSSSSASFRSVRRW